MALSNLMTDPPGGTYIGATQLNDGAITPQYGIDNVSVVGENGFGGQSNIGGINRVSPYTPAESSGSSNGFGAFVSKILSGDWTGAIGQGVDFLFGLGSEEANYQRNKRDYQEQFAANNAEYDRRFNQQNQWNAEWADRLRAQGINPLAAVGQGVSGQSATMSPSNAYSGPLSDMPNLLENMLTSAKTKNIKADTGLKDWDIQLKEQLYNYNSTAYPLLIDQAEATLTNTLQEYNNLVAKENFDKKKAEELEQKIINEQAQYDILVLQKILVEDEHKYNEARLKQMAQDFETGKFNQEFAKWHAQHEKALAFLAETQGKITNEQFEQLYANGLFGEMQQQEFENLKQTYNKLVAETGRENAEWQKLRTLGLGDSTAGFEGTFGRGLGLLIYLVTELLG